MQINLTEELVMKNYNIDNNFIDVEFTVISKVISSKLVLSCQYKADKLKHTYTNNPTQNKHIVDIVI